MAKLVQELQREALESKKETSEILRKALFVAKKLKLEDFAEWIQKEQKGYNEGDKVPEYRNVPGKLMASDPFYGWVPVPISNPNIEELLSKRYLHEPISHIEELISSGNNIAEVLSNVKEAIFKESDMHRSLIFDASIPFVKSIPKIVRDIILNWTLKLEEDGILGEDYTFTEKDKEVVTNPNYNIDNFISVNKMSHSQIQQGTIKSTQTQKIGLEGQEILSDFIKQLSNSLNQMGLESDRIKSLETELYDIKVLLKDDQQVGFIASKLQSIKAILEGAAGNLLASGVASKIPEIIAAISVK